MNMREHVVKKRNGQHLATADIHFAHFPVLEMTDILISYAYQGGTSLRLDAVGFMERIWNNLHSPSANSRCHPAVAFNFRLS
ncbi:hypothetical protein P7H09_03315 [Paenibacillus larvae]|uniref:Uncharacterized protein n=3 Tax=Paenibacillus larvae TaxID=1464 RepID=A0AAP5JR17_9BACL|nr:hypothetical protein [Paenibacillus larvae]